MRLILRESASGRNGAHTPLTKVSQTLTSLYHLVATLLPATAAQSLEEPVIQGIERDWHKDILVMVRDRLPKVVLVLLVLFLIQRIVSFFVKRLQRLAAHQPIIPGRSAQLRTVATILRATCYSIIGFLTFIQVLHLFNYDPTPLLASAGIVGVGIGLAAQSLFKDLINGVFILIEDQYNVGEVVKIAALTGTVEDLTLRLTRLRDADGTLYVIPNSQVAVVSNLSRDFSVATLSLSVDVSANPDLVLATLKEVATEVRTDPAYRNVFLADPIILGVDRIDGRAIQYPILFRVPPNQKDAILRELRRRIILVFEQKGIPFGIDPNMLITHAAADPTAAPTEQPLVKS